MKIETVIVQTITQSAFSWIIFNNFKSKFLLFNLGQIFLYQFLLSLNKSKSSSKQTNHIYTLWEPDNVEQEDDYKARL